MKFSKPSFDIVSHRLLEAFSKPINPIQISDDPVKLHSYVKRTALKTASISAALSVPGGITGFVSMVPEIAAIWRLQSQMVGSIALSHGYESNPGCEQMIWCMFRQFGFGVVSKYVFQQGGVYVVKQMNSQAFQAAIKHIGVQMIKHQGGRAASRLVPLAGSIASGALSYRDTQRVGNNALQLYSAGLRME